jgi:hypothetical protein
VGRPALSRLIDNSFVKTAFELADFEFHEFHQRSSLGINMGPRRASTSRRRGRRPAAGGRNPGLSKDQRTFEEFFNTTARDAGPIDPATCTVNGCPATVATWAICRCIRSAVA